MSIIIIKNKYFLLAVVFVAILLKAQGQAASSPFSTFGIGEYYGNALAHNQGMGGIGIGNPQFWYLNNQNPSLLVFNQFTMFAAGIIGESRTIRGDALNEQSRGGNLNYLAVAFPIIRPGKWTTSVGLMPYTNVDYRLQYNDEIEGSNSTTTVTEEGSGGLTQLYWSNGVRINKNISVGLKSSYIFGSVINSFSVEMNDVPQAVPFIVEVEEKTYTNDFSFSGGVTFNKDSIWRGNEYRVTIGAVYTFATNLKARRTDTFLRNTLLGDITDSVTLASLKGNVYIPAEIGFGWSIAKRNKWSVGADVRYQNWAEFESLNSEDEEGMTEYWSAAAGGEYTPDAFAARGYFNRITYRVGLSYEKSPFLANNEKVQDFGINFGFSMPTGRSSIDLAFKVGRRGNRSENILEENYFKLYFGLTLNDQWFIKRKFD